MKRKTILHLAAILLICGASCTKQNRNNQFTTKESRVMYYDSTNTQPGVILLDMVSQSKCDLIDRDGNSLKKYPFGLICFLNDGSMLGKKDSFLVKLDSSLNILWKTRFDFELHHEITVDDNGNIYVFGSHTHSFMGYNIRFDIVNILSKGGKLIYEWCVFDHLEEFIAIISKSAWLKHLPLTFEKCESIEQYIRQDPLRFIVPTDADCDCRYEFTHFNALQVIPENKLTVKIPAFKKGSLLISFHPYSCYGILDTSTDKIEWVGYLPERTRLHFPNLTADGTILVFQNCTPLGWTPRGGYDSLQAAFLEQTPHEILKQQPEPRLWTSVTEYDPLTNQKVWEYTTDPKESMCATSRGSAQRLPNGNTLVAATTKEQGGRAFELTPDKKIVWEYSYPEIDEQDSVPIGFYRVKWISNDFAQKIISVHSK